VFVMKLTLRSLRKLVVKVRDLLSTVSSHEVREIEAMLLRQSGIGIVNGNAAGISRPYKTVAARTRVWITIGDQLNAEES
jgi:hypothetical protein